MSYQIYKEAINSLVLGSNDRQLDLFAKDVIFRILIFVNKASRVNLLGAEKSRIEKLIKITTEVNIDWNEVGKILDELTKIAEDDEEHAMEMEFVEFLCALDNWREYNESGNKESIAKLSENLMNILDYYYVEDTTLDNWLSVKEIGEEFNRQTRFLENNA